MLFHGLASRDLAEVIEFYPDLAAAQRALTDALSNEPSWVTELLVVSLELPGDPSDPGYSSLN